MFLKTNVFLKNVFKNLSLHKECQVIEEIGPTEINSPNRNVDREV